MNFDLSFLSLAGILIVDKRYIEHSYIIDTINGKSTDWFWAQNRQKTTVTTGDRKKKPDRSYLTLIDAVENRDPDEFHRRSTFRPCATG